MGWLAGNWKIQGDRLRNVRETNETMPWPGWLFCVDTTLMVHSRIESSQDITLGKEHFLSLQEFLVISLLKQYTIHVIS